MVQLRSPTDEDQQLWVPPAFFPILAFLGGIAFDDFFPAWIAVVCALIPTSLLAYLGLRRRPSVDVGCLVILAATAGALHHYQFNHVFSQHHIRTLMPEDSPTPSLRVTLTGVVAGSPVISRPEKMFPYHSPPNLRTRLTLDVQQINAGTNARSVCGLAEVVVAGMTDRLHAGERIEAEGRLVSTSNPGADFPTAHPFRYYTDNRIFVRLFVSNASDVRVLGDRRRVLAAVYEKMRQLAQGMLLRDETSAGEYTRGLLVATILGDRDRMATELNDAMVRIGAAHYLAVSGFNLAMLAAGLWALGSLIGWSDRTKTIIVIVCTIVYTCLTDFQPSIVRSTLMILIFSVGFLLNRPSLVLNSLAISAFLILLINPNQLFNAGFQLSFLATLGLVVFSRPIYRALFVPEITIRPAPVILEGSGRWGYRWAELRAVGAYGLEALRVMLCASLAASLTAVPLVMYHFGILSLIGPVASVVLFPVASLLTLAGFAQLVLVTVLPAAGFLLAGINNALCAILAWISLLMAKIPGVSVDVPPPPVLLILVYLAILYSPLLSRRDMPLLAGWRRPALLAVVAAYLTLWLICAPAERGWIHVAGSGEGQRVTVCAGRELIFIDAGSARVGQAGEFVRQVGARYLARPAAVVLTCPDQQFFNDLWSLTDANTRIKVFTSPGFNADFARHYAPVKMLLEDAAVTKEPVTAGALIRASDTTLTLLHPPADLPEAFSAGAAFKRGRLVLPSMEEGAVVLVRVAGMNVLVSSVLNAYACNRLCRDYPDLRAEVVVINAAGEPGRGLVRLIQCLKVRRLVLTGRPTAEQRLVLREVMQRCGCELIEVAERGGYLITYPDASATAAMSN